MHEDCRWAYQSPLGALTLTVGPAGVRSVSFGRLTDAGPCRDCREIAGALDAYFSGDGPALDAVAVDLSLAAGDFQRRVLETLRATVPAGSTVTYAALATAVGRPGAARAVGGAMARNPVPILVPCHRVLASDGGLGGYGGGLEWKRSLLEIEAAGIPARRAAAG